MILARTKKVGSIAIIFFMVMVGVLYFVISHIEKQGAKLMATATAVADYSAQYQSSIKLESLLSETADQRAILEAVQLTEADTISFLSTIENIANAQGVTLTTDSLAVEESDQDRELKIVLSIEGGTDRVQEMIALLETVPYASYIEQVSLSTQDAENTAAATASVTLKIIMPPL